MVVELFKKGDPKSSEEGLVKELKILRAQLAVFKESEEERKKAELELKKLNELLEQHINDRTYDLIIAETKYKSLVEEIPAVIYLAKPEINSETIYINPQVNSLLGFTQQEWTSNPTIWANSIHPEDRERVTNEYQECLSKAKTFETEYRFIKKDKTIIWVHDKAKILHDGQNNARFVQGIIFNITEQKKAEQALKESRARFKLLFENNPNPMFVYELETLNIIEVNEAAIEHYGYSHKEFINMKLTDIRPIEDVSRLLTYVNDIRKAPPKLRFTGEWRHLLKNGKIICVEASSHSFELEGQMVAMVVVNDITERKKVEKELLYMDSIIEHSYDGIMSETLDGYITSWNPAMEKIYGYKKEEAIGKHFLMLHPPESTDRFSDIGERVKHGEVIEQYETIRLRKDGSRINVSMTISPIRQKDSTIIGISAIVRDITRYKELQAELELAKQREQQKKELMLLEESSPIDKDLTVKLFDLEPFKKHHPAIFMNIVKRYEDLIDLFVKNKKSESVKQEVSRELYKIAKELGTLKAGPNDVIEIHSKVTKAKNKETSCNKAQEYTEIGRSMLFELIGHLVLYYRRISLIPKQINGNKVLAGHF